MKKSKKIAIIGVSLLAAVGLIAGLTALKNSRNAAYVEPVENLNNEWMRYNEQTSGTVSQAGSQSIYCDGDVAEVYVRQGDTVNAGDRLFRYDTTEKEITLEARLLEAEDAAAMLETAKKLLEQYSAQPVSEPTQDGEEPEGLTEQEKNRQVENQKIEVRKCENALKQAQNAVKLARADLNDAVVTSKISGVVKSIGEAGVQSEDPRAFCVIAAASGLQITGYLSETDYETTKPGDILEVESWMTGTQTQARIVSVSEYPTSEYGEWMPSVSYYSFTAVLEGSAEFEIGEDVGIRKVKENGDGIFLEKIYVRSDENGAYCMIDDGAGRLKKQPVTVKSTQESEYVEILDGLGLDDLIAFPYGKSGKEGTKTTDRMSFHLF